MGAWPGAAPPLSAPERDVTVVTPEVGRVRVVAGQPAGAGRGDSEPQAAIAGLGTARLSGCGPSRTPALSAPSSPPGSRTPGPRGGAVANPELRLPSRPPRPGTPGAPTPLGDFAPPSPSARTLPCLADRTSLTPARRPGVPSCLRTRPCADGPSAGGSGLLVRVPQRHRAQAGHRPPGKPPAATGPWASSGPGAAQSPERPPCCAAGHTHTHARGSRGESLARRPL